MSKYTYLLNRIIEDAGASGSTTSGMVGPMTSTGQGLSVAYLPGGFSTTKNMLRSLSTAKKKWKVNVLEEGDNYKVSFEDVINFSVPKQAYEEFNNKVVRVHGRQAIDLTEMVNECLNEQRSEMLQTSYARLLKVLSIDFRENTQIKKTISLLNYWTWVFKNSQFLDTPASVAIDLGHFDQSVKNFLDRIKKVQEDNIGEIQMMANAIRQDRPLNAFEPWNECDSAAGVRVRTEYGGIIMVLEMTVGISMVPANSLYIESKDVLEELTAFRSVRVVKDIVFPVGMMFNATIFGNIKNVIDELSEKENEHR